MWYEITECSNTWRHSNRFPKSFDVQCDEGLNGRTIPSGQLGVSKGCHETGFNAIWVGSRLSRGLGHSGNHRGATTTHGSQQTRFGQLAIRPGDGVEVDAKVCGQLSDWRKLGPGMQDARGNQVAETRDQLVVEGNGTGERNRDHFSIVSYNDTNASPVWPDWGRRLGLAGFRPSFAAQSTQRTRHGTRSMKPHNNWIICTDRVLRLNSMILHDDLVPVIHPLIWTDLVPPPSRDPVHVNMLAK